MVREPELGLSKNEPDESQDWAAEGAEIQVSGKTFNSRLVAPP